MKPFRFVVLISGNGSNLQALLDAAASGTLPAHIAAVISNKRDAFGLERARNASIPALVKVKYKDQDRSEYDRELAELVESYSPDFVILAGWMRLLTPVFLDRFSYRVVNLHPALPGAFPGTHAIERAFAAYQKGEITHSGIMVHYVVDAGVDSGPVIAQKNVPLYPQDTLEQFENRVHTCEHQVLVNAVQTLIRQKEEEDA